VCVCVCVCVRERERELDGGGERRERASDTRKKFSNSTRPPSLVFIRTAAQGIQLQTIQAGQCRPGVA